MFFGGELVVENVKTTIIKWAVEIINNISIFDIIGDNIDWIYEWLFGGVYIFEID